MSEIILATFLIIIQIILIIGVINFVDRTNPFKSIIRNTLKNNNQYMTITPNQKEEENKELLAKLSLLTDMIKEDQTINEKVRKAIFIIQQLLNNI